MSVHNEIATRRLLLSVLYKGPWEYVTTWLWKVNKADADGNFAARDQVTDDSIRGRLADWADRRDLKWRDKYAKTDTRPNDRWKRKS